jgi:hypothetical protein
MEAPADQAASDRGYNIHDFNVVIYAAPPEPCSPTGERGGLRVHLYGHTTVKTLVHELGHRLGLGHGHALACFDASGNPVTLSANCGTNEYGDDTNAMGSGHGIYSAIQLASLGWLPSLVQDVPQSGGGYVLQPLDTLAGGAPLTRALRIQDGPTILWVEYRQPGVLDSNADTQGVFIRLQRPDDSGPYGSFLLDVTPGGGLANLRVGASWTNPLGAMKITVDSADASLAHITVTNPSPFVPNVLSLDDDNAQNAIRAAGLTVGSIHMTANCAQPLGFVLTQNPRGGTQVPGGTPVNLTESTGSRANGKPCLIE